MIRSLLRPFAGPWAGLRVLLLGVPAMGAAAAADAVFDDPVWCRGHEFEVRRSEVDKAFLQLRANATLRGQSIPEEQRDALNMALLDRLVVTRLLSGRANDDDRRKARESTDRFIAGLVEEAGSESAFKRQLLTMGFTRDELDLQVYDRILCETVTERELLGRNTITDAQVKAYYDENLEKLRRPEMIRARHILLTTKDPVTNAELTSERKAEKKAKLAALLDRARKGENFAALAREHSEDQKSKADGGEYLFARGKIVPAEIESAAISLQTNGISDIVTSSFGYHIVQLIQRIPPETSELSKVETEIRDKLAREQLGKELLPPYLEKLRNDAKLEYLNGAKPNRQ